MIQVRSSILDARGGPRYRFNITTLQESTHEDK
jgi:hypothetical protein